MVASKIVSTVTADRLCAGFFRGLSGFPFALSIRECFSTDHSVKLSVMKANRHVISSSALALVVCAGPIMACELPRGFVDTPHPAVVSTQSLVRHTERIDVSRSLETVLAAAGRPLEEQIKKSSELPGIKGSYPLTPGTFGAVGTRRLNCLSDGSTLVEQVLSSERERFRYIVWNYTSDAAKAVKFGIGEFTYEALPNGHTRIHWTYSFALNESRFPGRLGGLGRYLFHEFFLEEDYATMMRGVLASIKAAAEAGPDGAR